LIGAKAGLEGAAGTSMTARLERKKLRERYLLFEIESDKFPTSTYY
jgi:hypothetical protein